jgi:hypothetical protein
MVSKLFILFVIDCSSFWPYLEHLVAMLDTEIMRYEVVKSKYFWIFEGFWGLDLGSKVNCSNRIYARSETTPPPPPPLQMGWGFCWGARWMNVTSTMVLDFK